MALGERAEITLPLVGYATTASPRDKPKHAGGRGIPQLRGSFACSMLLSCLISARQFCSLPNLGSWWCASSALACSTRPQRSLKADRTGCTDILIDGVPRNTQYTPACSGAQAEAR